MDTLRKGMKQNCFFISKLLFEVLGVSIRSNQKFWYRIYSNFMMTVAFLYPWSNLYTVIDNLQNFNMIINGMFNFVGGLSGFLKIVVILYNKSSLVAILRNLEIAQKERGPKERAKVYTLNKWVLIMGIILWSSIFYFSVGTMFGRLTNKDPTYWKTPVADVAVINITYSPNYELAWAFQSIGSLLASSSFCLSVVFVATIIIDLTIELKMLHRNIIQIRLYHDSEDRKPRPHLRETIKQIVTQHLTLLKLIDQFEVISNILVLLDVFGNICMISFSVYHGSVQSSLSLSTLQSYDEVIMIVLSLFCVCYSGSEMSLAGQSIAAACYEIDFVGTNVRFQKDLLMIMMRSQKPIKLTVGRFTGLSINVFAWIIKNSYTYLMILRKSNYHNH